MFDDQPIVTGAKAIEGEVTWNEALFSYDFADPRRLNLGDSAPFMPKNIVVSPFFDWGNDRAPRIPYHQTVIYEAHVKGLTKPTRPSRRSSGAPTPGWPIRPSSSTCKSIGVTAVELLPVHQFVPEHFLVARGLTNYWGYNTMGYLAPHNAYSSSGQCGEQVLEFKAMVQVARTRRASR